MMQPFSAVTGPAAPLLQRDLDTDVIIRIERLTQIQRNELGPYAFEAMRNGDFILDQPRFRGAPILLAGANFGCGSSREGAVWAMAALGLRVVIAPSYGDIFFSNCFQNGMLPVVLQEDSIRNIAKQCGSGAALTVDLHSCLVTAPDGTNYDFRIDPLHRKMLLEGADELALTLRRMDGITAWQQRDAASRPWAVPRRENERA